MRGLWRIFVGAELPGTHHFSEHFLIWENEFIMSSTVAGSEIRGSPVEVGSLSHYLRRVLFTSFRWLAGFLNHQQYGCI